MSVEQPDFLIAYNAIEVPAPVRAIDVLDMRPIAANETFFRAIEASLYLGERTLELFFERDIISLPPVEAPPKYSVVEGQARIRDDYITLIKKRGGQTLASVLFARDDAVQQIAHFAKYPLLPETIDEIRELRYFDDITRGIE